MVPAPAPPTETTSTKDKSKKRKMRPTLLANNMKRPKRSKTSFKIKSRKLSDEVPISKSLGNAGHLQIVPWASSAEWEHVCLLFNNEDYTSVISEILIWTKRAPSIPIGVESTLYLLQAIEYDKSEKADWAIEIVQSLYSLAIIRYLNHVSHLATRESGSVSSTMFELASYINVPDWIVNLRHEASHGGAIPSVEVLRLAAEFIKSWLKENYWIPQDDTQAESQILLQHSKRSSGRRIVLLISAFIATRVYKLRSSKMITDPEVLRLVSKTPPSSGIGTKKVFASLKTEITKLLRSNAEETCSLIAEEMIPPISFYQDLNLICNKDDGKDTFDALYMIWSPLIKILSEKDLLINVLINLCKIHASEESNEDASRISALWINKVLQRIQENQETSVETEAGHQLKDLLPILLNSPKPSSDIFLHRFYEIIGPLVGLKTVEKLATLSSIWADETEEFDTGKKYSKLFSVDDIVQPELAAGKKEIVIQQYSKWELDRRGGKKFWSTIPIGTIFNG